MQQQRQSLLWWLIPIVGVLSVLGALMVALGVINAGQAQASTVGLLVLAGLTPFNTFVAANRSRRASFADAGWKREAWPLMLIMPINLFAGYFVGQLISGGYTDPQVHNLVRYGVQSVSSLLVYQGMQMWLVAGVGQTKRWWVKAMTVNGVVCLGLWLLESWIFQSLPHGVTQGEATALLTCQGVLHTIVVTLVVKAMAGVRFRNALSDTAVNAAISGGLGIFSFLIALSVHSDAMSTFLKEFIGNTGGLALTWFIARRR